MKDSQDRSQRVKTGAKKFDALRKQPGLESPRRKPERWTSAGGVVLPDKHTRSCYVIQPRGNFGGRPWTLPKGRVDQGESKEAAAIREVREETGLEAKILPGSLLGKFRGTMSETYYYVMVRKGGSTSRHDDEVSEVKEVSLPDAASLFERTGNRRDAKVVQKAIVWLDERGL